MPDFVELENPDPGLCTEERPLCACGCGEAALPRKGARYASRACKTRDWKHRHGIIGYKAVKVSRRRKNSGLQVSYYRAFKALTAMTALEDHEIEQALQAALPDRQRAELHAREQRR